MLLKVMMDTVLGLMINVKLLVVIVLLIPLLLINVNNKIVNVLMMVNNALKYPNVKIIKHKFLATLKELMDSVRGYLHFHLI